MRPRGARAARPSCFARPDSSGPQTPKSKARSTKVSSLVGSSAAVAENDLADDLANAVARTSVGVRCRADGTRFQIEPDGTVGQAMVAASELDAPAVEACLVDLFGGVVFRPVEGGGVVIVNYPFFFSTSAPEDAEAR